MQRTEHELRSALRRHNAPTTLALIAKLTAIPASRLRAFLAGASLTLPERLTLARYAWGEPL